MYLADYHTHTSLSPDSTAPLEQQVEAAIRAGLSELCITDHYDTRTLDGKPNAPFDWAPAVEQYLRVKEQVRGRLELRLGIEFGSGHLDGDALRRAPAELDFVIGSLHNRSDALGGADFYVGPYDSYQMCKETLDDYFASMAALAPTGAYDVLGHIIYPLRYMERDGQDISLDPWMDQIEACMKVAVETGRGMEVNTYNGRTLEPWRPVLKLYRDLGGEIVTTGSDGHTPKNIGRGIPEACGLLREAGFRYLATYRGRKPDFVKL